jgi:transposase-like protein
MTDYEINVPGGVLSSLLSEKNGLAVLVEAVLNQILDAQASEQVGAQRYERSDERVAYRNGYRPRQLYTRIGPLTLCVPQMRDGQFSTEIFSRYQRSEQALVLSLMEMVVNGVSTRKVTRITEELCGVTFSKSSVSQLCMALDGRVAAFNERELGAFPFVIVDAMYFKAREGDSVQSKAAMVVSGVKTRCSQKLRWWCPESTSMGTVRFLDCGSATVNPKLSGLKPFAGSSSAASKKFVMLYQTIIAV